MQALGDYGSSDEEEEVQQKPVAVQPPKKAASGPAKANSKKLNLDKGKGTSLKSLLPKPKNSEGLQRKSGAPSSSSSSGGSSSKWVAQVDEVDTTPFKG